jgi:hypothetical protein
MSKTSTRTSMPRTRCLPASAKCVMPPGVVSRVNSALIARLLLTKGSFCRLEMANKWRITSADTR